MPTGSSLTQVSDATISLGGTRTAGSFLMLSGEVSFLNGAVQASFVQPVFQATSVRVSGQFTGAGSLSINGSSTPLHFDGQVLPFNGRTSFNHVVVHSANSYDQELNLTNMTFADAGTFASTTVSFTNAITFDNTSTAIPNRLPSTATLAGSGQVRLLGNASTPLIQTIGSLQNDSGTLAVSVKDTGQLTQFHTSSLNLSADTLLGIDVSSPLGRFTTGSVVAMVGGGSAPTQRAIVPMTAAGEATMVNLNPRFISRGFVTYDATPTSGGSGAEGVVGFRALQEDEYATPIASAAALDNVLLQGSAPSLAGPASINSLVLSSSTDLNLGGDLTVASGQILHRDTSASDGGAGAVIRSIGGVLRSAHRLQLISGGASVGTSQPLIITAPIDAPSVIALGPTVRLDGINAVPGGVTAMAGLLTIGRPEALGSGPLTMRGNVNFIGDQTISNQLVVKAGSATATSIGSTTLLIGVEQGHTLTVNGSLNLVGDLTATGGLLRLMGGGVVTGSLGGRSTTGSPSRIELGGSFTNTPNLITFFQGKGEIYGNATTAMSFQSGLISAGAPGEVGTLTLANLRPDLAAGSATATIRVDIDAAAADRLIVKTRLHARLIAARQSLHPEFERLEPGSVRDCLHSHSE